jgi:hypothetical protein
MTTVRNVAALTLIRLAAGMVAVAAKLAIRTLPDETVTLLDAMSDDHWLAMADGEILSAALRGLR